MLTAAHVRHRTIASLPFNSETKDIVLHREKGKLRCNISQDVVHHSPTGFEIAYAGSGPADLALNILAIFLPVEIDKKRVVRCHYGKVSALAWLLHQQFKREFIATMPRAGGVIRGEEILRWLEQNLPDARRAALSDVSTDFDEEGDE